MSPLTGILHGAGLWQLPKQLYLPTEEKSAQAPNSHLKYVWYDPRCHSLFLQALLLLSSYSLNVGHFLCFPWIRSRICCSFSLPYLSSFLLSCLKKKKEKKKRKNLEGSLPTFHEKKKSGKMFDLDPTHGSQPALPCSHRAMLKGFYKPSAKAAS